jgi:hypothetical protein
MSPIRLLPAFATGAALAIGLLTLAAANDPADSTRATAPSLCRASEAVLFQCRIGGTLAAVCGGHANGRSYAQYRHGAPGRLDLAYPADPAAGPGSMSYASAPYSGGGEAQIRFVNQGSEYVIYGAVIRTGFGRGGNRPVEEDGLLVRRGGRTIANLRCAGHVDAVDLGHLSDFLPEGEFVERE